LAERGFRVEGLDLSPFLIERMREYNGGRYDIPVYCADIHQPPEELCGRYDAVVGFFVLHHLADLHKAFAAIGRLLRPGGRAVFLEPNPYNPLYYAQLLITPGMSWSAEQGIWNMRPGVVFSAMQATGMTRIGMTRYGFFPPFLSNRAWGMRLERALEQISLWRPFLPFQLFRGERP
ncbi:MAG: class I SAM-dependent methyltransferase, partial [Anaerolineae bacterium]|nr:class I SAM-dependent methyltransferase [Anaerolineae bacterium]